MPKLQACPKCGAQFDVSPFATGQQFTCGACGTVVTAGAAPAAAARVPVAPARVPPAPSRVGAAAMPSRPVPAPAGRAAGARGPQYVPLDRHHEAPAPARGAPAGSRHERGGRRDRGEHEVHGRKPGLSPAALAGICGGVLVVVVGLAFVLLKKGDDGAAKPTTVGAKGATGTTGPTGTTPSAGAAGAASAPGMGTPAPSGTGPTAVAGAGGPSPSTETLDQVESDWKKKSAHSLEEAVAFFNRYKALGAKGEERAKDVAREIIRLDDPNYRPAHELLGHKEFAHDVPEIISFRQYPYIRAVEEAAAQRWFDDDEAYALAMKAWEKTEAHAKKLDPDHGDSTFRALDGARQLIARDPKFKDYNYEAIFASPYLICYSSEERLAEEDFLRLSKKERQEKLAELEKKREGFRRTLAEKAKIYQQLYKEFLKRYGEDCDLHDLMAPFGGRPDLPPGKRSYRDGCPVIVWIFSDKKAFDEYHEVVAKERIDASIAGYFSPMTGWVYLYDGDDREFEINKNVHEGTHQLEHWFQMQKREWGKPVVPQSFFGEGFAEYMGSVSMAKDRTLTFHGINRPRLEFLKHMKQQAKQGNKKLNVFPLKELVGFEGYHNVRAWGAQNWGFDAIFHFYAQSWAFVYFLNEYSDHKYKPKFTKFLDDMLNHPRDKEGYAFERFKRDFDIKSEDDWKRLDKEFGDFYDKLIDMDLAKVAAQPPARDDWPGYVPIEPTNPLDSSSTAPGGAKGDGKKDDAAPAPVR